MAVIRRKKEDVEKNKEAKQEVTGLRSERNEMSADEILWGAYYRMRHTEEEPRMQDFRDVFPETEIAADARRLEAKERDYREVRDERAATLEAFLSSDEVSEANWFGTKESPLHVQRVTRFDDSFTGVDSVWEWRRPEDGKVVRLAFDATSASDEVTLYAKLNKVQDSVQNKTMGKVKYFRSDLPGSGAPGHKEQIPHVVIGTDAEGIQRLAKDYMPLVTAMDRMEKLDVEMKKATSGKMVDEKKALQETIRTQKAKIEQDPLPSMILEQINSQLSLQIVDAVGCFIRDYGSRAFGDSGMSEAVTAVRSNLTNLLLKYRNKEEYGPELKQLMEAVKDALPAIEKIDSRRGSQLVALHDTLSFIKGLIEEKNKSRRGAASAAPEAKRKTNQVLSDRWSPYVNSQLA